VELVSRGVMIGPNALSSLWDGMKKELTPTTLVEIIQRLGARTEWQVNTLRQNYEELINSEELEVENGSITSGSQRQFQFASLLYRIVSEEHTHNAYMILFCEYCLYRIYDTERRGDVYLNPFLYHFIRYYHYTASELIQLALRHILNEDGINLGNQSMNELNDELRRYDQIENTKILTTPKLRQYLLDQGFDDQEVVEVVEDKKYRDDFINPRIEPRKQLIAFHHQAGREKNRVDENIVRQLNNLYPTMGVLDYDTLNSLTDPFNWLTKHVFNHVLVTDDQISRLHLIQHVLIRVQANHDWVDFIHNAIISNRINPSTELPILIHEFVSFNLQTYPFEWVVRLLCTFLLSLSNKNFLSPSKDYQALFSGFLPWIGTIHEAWLLYVSANNTQ
jgi:hypothetical protein